MEPSVRNSRTTAAGHLDRIGLFALVAETGSVAEAARRLGVVKSSVSTRLARLERDLAARLFDRSAAGMRLTEAGLSLQVHARAILKEAEAAIVALRAQEAPRGTLRVSMPAGIADPVVLPALARFLEAFPGIGLDIVATDAILDLDVERIDVALRVGWIEDGRFVARRLTSLTDVLCAAPSYLAAVAPFERPSDLERCAWIGFRAFGARQTLHLTDAAGSTVDVTVDCRVATTSGLQIKHWAVAGAGVCRMPVETMAEELADGRLVRVLPTFVTTPAASLYLVHRAERQRPANVRRLIDFLVEAFRPPPQRRRNPAPIASSGSSQ
jgi:DNA-binding transcriptional LysR family regulator